MKSSIFQRIVFAGLSFLGLITLGCSKEDIAPEEPIPNIHLNTFLSTDLAETQMDVFNDGRAPLITNLNEQLGLDFLIFGRRDVDQNSVSFNFWQGQQSNIYYKNLDSDRTFEVIDVCDFNGERDFPKVIRSVDGNEFYSVLAYTFQPEDSAPQFAFRIQNRETLQCQDLSIPDILPAEIENFSLEGQWLGLYYRDQNTDNPFLALVDLSLATLSETINLDPNFQGATFKGSELWIFNSDFTYLVFNAASGTIVRSGTAPGLPAQGPGMFDSRFFGNQLLVRFIYQQPSLFFAQPAVYDFDAMQLVEGAEPFLPELQERIEAETGDRFLFGNYGTDLASGTIALSYVKGNGSAIGGIVLTNFDLDWFEILELPLVPEVIEFRSLE